MNNERKHHKRAPIFADTRRREREAAVHELRKERRHELCDRRRETTFQLISSSTSSTSSTSQSTTADRAHESSLSTQSSSAALASLLPSPSSLSDSASRREVHDVIDRLHNAFARFASSSSTSSSSSSSSSSIDVIELLQALVLKLVDADAVQAALSRGAMSTCLAILNGICSRRDSALSLANLKY